MIDSATDSYRPLSILAVIAGVLGGLSALSWIAPTLVGVAAFAAIVGGVAVVRLWGRSADAAGSRLAISGSVVSLICLCGASLWHWQRYVIEVPDGFERIELSDIFNSASDAFVADQVLNERGWRDESTDRQQRSVLAATALQLNGQRIAVKGYIDPYFTHEPVSAFTMSRRGWTGFGSQAEPGEQLIIQLTEGATLDYSGAPVVVSGVFHVETDSSRGAPQLRLVLKNAIIRPATSTIGLPPRNGGNC